MNESVASAALEDEAAAESQPYPELPAIDPEQRKPRWLDSLPDIHEFFSHDGTDEDLQILMDALSASAMQLVIHD